MTLGCYFVVCCRLRCFLKLIFDFVNFAPLFSTTRKHSCSTGNTLTRQLMGFSALLSLHRPFLIAAMVFFSLSFVQTKIDLVVCA